MSDGVSIRLEQVEIPTYEAPADSPYPSYGWSRRRGTYPYSRRTNLSTEVRPMRHRMVVLENEYVLVAVTPDMGGRVFRLYDKVAGQETFMVPPSIKFQNVSNRGAWIAGGIEFNFGHRGHSVHTVTPVSWAMRRDDDGGASCWVGTTIRPMGSRWALRIRVRPGRAAMDLEVHAMGPPVLPGMMYWWSNAGVEVTEQSRFFYFGLHADAMHFRHGWPIADGLDYSWYRNRLLEADMFLMEAQRDYLGFYDYGRRHGLAQTADVHLAPGQKYFTWGTHQEGRFWDVMFSDVGQTYCEIQRGRMPTQGVTEPLPAVACESWAESWIPIRETEGFSATESDLVLSVNAEAADRSCIRLLGVSRRRELRLRAEAGGRSLGEWDVEEVSPETLFTRRVDTPAGRPCDRVTVLDAGGEVLLDWTEFQYQPEDWYSDHSRHREPDGQTTDDLFAQAERHRFLHWPSAGEHAAEAYERILARDAGHAGAHAALAETHLFAGRLAEAEDHLRRAMARRPGNGGLLTTLGWTLLWGGRDAEAVDAFANASRYEASRRGALVGLAGAHLASGRVREAGRAVARLLDERPADAWGRWAEVVVLRRSGRADRAAEVLGELLEADPIWARLQAEAVLLGVDGDLAAGTRTLPDDSVTAAEPYIDLRLWDDARVLLERAESDEPFSPAIRLAHLAYVCERLGDGAAAGEALRRMREATPEQANPWSGASIRVLSELAAAHPDEAMVQYMLGNVLADRSRLEEAEAAWRRASAAGLAHPVLESNLALARSHLGDGEGALEHYRRAWRGSDRDVYLFTAFDRFLASRGRHEERLAVYEELDEAKRARSMAAMRRLLQLLDVARYDEALEELGRRTFLRGEFEKTIRYQYLEAVAGKAVDLMNDGQWRQAEDVLAKGFEYPRNINMGRHGTMPNEAVVNYLMGLSAEADGREEAARSRWLAAAEELHMDGHPIQAYEMLAWLALGNRPRALALAHRLEQFARGQGDVPWWYKYYYGSSAPAVCLGMTQLVKGHLDVARDVWRKALEDEPGGRWLPLQLRLSDDLLRRMARQVTGPSAAPKPRRARRRVTR